VELFAMAAIPVLFSMAESAWPLNIPDSLDINEAAPSKPRKQLASLCCHHSYHRAPSFP